MLCSDLPVRVTSFLRDPSTGLAKNGIYDISEESKNRSIIISSRIANRKQKEIENQFKSDDKLTWEIYSNYLDSQFVENLRFVNELRSEFGKFMTLMNKYVLAGILYSSNEVKSATYIILRGIYKIYRQKQKHFGNDEKIKTFIQSVHDDITKYFSKLSNKQWNEIYEVGIKLLYFLSNPQHLQQNELSKTLKNLNADSCHFDYNSLPKSLFSKMEKNENNDNNNKKDEYKLNDTEYGADIDFNDPLIEMNQLLLPQMTALEKKQYFVENHEPSNAARFKQPKVKKQTENGTKSKKKQKKKQPKNNGKYSVEWIREKAQFIAMMKLQFGGDDGQMMDVETLTLQILELIHNTSYSDMILQSQFTDLLGLDAFDLITELIQNRAKITKLTSNYMNYQDQPQVLPPNCTQTDGIVISQRQTNNPYGASFSIMTESQKKREKQKVKERKKMRGKTMSKKSKSKNRNDVVIRRRNEAHENYKKTMRLMGYVENNQVVDDKEMMPSNVTTTIHKLGTGTWEEVHCPAPESKQIEEINNAERIDISESFPPWAQLAFLPFGIKKLNPMQSQCFEKAFNSNNNLLICAPTGAGKTNVAIMATLREIGANLKNGVLAV